MRFDWTLSARLSHELLTPMYTPTVSNGEKSFQMAISAAVMALLASNAAPTGAAGGAGAAFPVRTKLVLAPELRPRIVTDQVCGPPQFHRISTLPELSATRRENTPLSSGAENSTASPGAKPVTTPSGRTIASHRNGFSNSCTCSGAWADAAGTKAAMPLRMANPPRDNTKKARASETRNRLAMAYIARKSTWLWGWSGGARRIFVSSRRGRHNPCNESQR